MVLSMVLNKSNYLTFSGLMLCFVASGYFLIHGLGLGSDVGYMSISRLNDEINLAEAKLNEISLHRSWLQHRVSLVAEGEVDQDLLSELAQSNGNLFAKNDLIIKIN